MLSQAEDKMSDATDLMVSCLMVTLAAPERLLYLRRSIADYCRQRHANKELVIVLDAGPPETKAAIAEHIGSLRRSDIRIIDPSGKRSLGALRNIALESASGDVCCQWDDDDLNHPQRLERQLQFLLETDSEAGYLQETMLFFPGFRTLRCTNWRAYPARGNPATLMCRRGTSIHYPEIGPESQLGEDLAVALQLIARNACRSLPDAPHLYVYVSHGRNTCPIAQHQLAASRLSISRALLLRREGQMREGLQVFDFGPEDIDVEGYNGLAFTLTTATSSR
jgi:glycosyltransferase involved in cell wall biosynthesis